MRLGLSQRDLGVRLGVQQITVSDWELGKTVPKGPYRRLVEEFLTAKSQECE
jgi:DNA-binding transcriptional regulator YiaG